MRLPPRHFCTTFSPAPELRAPIPSLGHRSSSRLSKSARRICHAPTHWRTPIHPRHLHSSQMPPRPPWVPCYSNMTRTPGSHSHSSLKNKPSPTEVQRLRSRATGHLRGRKAFPPHAGSAPLHHLHRPQANHLRLPTEAGQMLSASAQQSKLCRTVHNRHQAHLWTGQRCRRCPLSRVESATAPPSTTHWPHRRAAATSSEHSWGQPPPCGSRNYQSPAPRYPSTAKRLPGDLDRTFQIPYVHKCSSPSMICRTQAPKQRRSWSHSVL
jgi:hypothetical protein